MSPRKQNMTPLGRVLAIKEMTFDELAAKTNIDVQRLYNLASGGAKSRRARRKIEAALGISLWPQGNASPMPEEAAS